MKKPVVFFDVGGTLMNGPSLSPVSRICSMLSLDRHESDYVSNMIFTENIGSADEFAERIMELASSSLSYLVPELKRLWGLQKKEGFPADGSFTAINSALSAGCRIALISNIWKPYYDCFRELFADYPVLFRNAVLSFKAGVMKPEPEIFRIALERVKALDGEKLTTTCIMVGDSFYDDILPAHRLGFKTVWVAGENVSLSRDELERGGIPEPDMILSCPGDLTVEKIQELI